MSELDSPKSRGEQKARKALLSLDLKPVKGINRVSFTIAKGIQCAISKPDVFMSMNSDTYIIFGEMQKEDLNAPPAIFDPRLAEEAEKVLGNDKVSETINEEETTVDADGVKEEDITTVMSQASVTRTKAIEALKKHENDVINAIMELTQ